MKHIKKITQVLLSALLVFSLIGCSQKDATKMQEEFDTFIKQELVNMMESDFLTAHMSFEHPENYGIDMTNVEVSLGEGHSADEAVLQEKLTEYEQEKEAFKQFDRKLLNEEQQETYDIYASILSSEERSLKKEYLYLGTAFEEGNGLHVQLATVFANFPLRNETDVPHLITLVNEVESYVQSAIDYTLEQLNTGNLMLNIKSVREYCEKIVTKGMDSSLLKDMKESIDALSIEESQKTTYKSELETAFKDSFLPAYQLIIDSLVVLEKGENNTQGFYYLENGKEFYEALVQNTIGDNTSIKDVKKTLEKTAENYYQTIMSIGMKNPDAYEKALSGDIKTTYNDYETMLSDLDNRFAEDFPKVDNLNYTINNLDPEVVSDLIAAYFIVPAIDQSVPMRIFVNNTSANSINDVSTFATVAHEGIPGHMYQTAYTAQNLKNPYRVFASSNSAYTEGYAKYVEMLSYSYVDGIEQDVADIMVANEIYIYCLMVISDIGIHYEGWTMDDFMDYLKESGLNVTDKEGLQSQYDQLQGNPAAFIPYFYGFAKFDELREKAEKQLGNKFNAMAFHEAILKSGEAPFSVVEENVADYIKANK